MNSFPYDSWDEAIADADGASGYYTFANNNTITMIIVLLAIALAIYTVVHYVTSENRHLNEAADRLSSKYREV